MVNEPTVSIIPKNAINSLDDYTVFGKYFLLLLDCLEMCSLDLILLDSVVLEEDITTIYSGTSIEMDDDGYYKTFTLENGDKIKADNETIKVFGLENNVNKITPNRTEPSNHS